MPRGASCALIGLLLVPLATACSFDWTVVPRAGADGGGGSCQSSKDCDAKQVCTFADLRCGKGVAGRCTPIPAAGSCSKDTTCGCDGLTYGDRCAAAAAGTDVSTTACATAKDQFACGFVLCGTGDYCLETPSGGGFDYVCIGWTCPEHDCKCTEVSAKCAGTCEVTGPSVIQHCASK